METLKGANTTAQWYQGKYPGAVFPWLDKCTIHTTETGDKKSVGWPGYNGGAAAPNLTIAVEEFAMRQHHENLRSARALQDPTSTAVRENRDNNFQIELIAYSDYALARSRGGLWIGDMTAAHYDYLADRLIELNKRHRLPLQSSVKWKEGSKSYVSGVRLSGPSFDKYKGILGHVHVSGNVHWDPGGFYWSRLEAAIKRRLGGTITPPVAGPSEEEVDMSEPYISKYGSSQWRLITDMWAPIPMTAAQVEAAKDKPGSPGLKIKTLSNATINTLTNLLPSKFVARGGKLIPLNQEIADAKTQGMAANVKADAILKALEELPEVDTKALAAQVASEIEAIETGDVIESIGEILQAQGQGTEEVTQ